MSRVGPNLRVGWLKPIQKLIVFDLNLGNGRWSYFCGIHVFGAVSLLISVRLSLDFVPA